MASEEIEALAGALARLPGLGPRSARRAVLHLMKKRQTALEPLLSALQRVAERLSTCSTCGNVDTSDPCGICRDPRRDDPGVVHDDKGLAELLGQVAEAAVPHIARRAVVDEEP